jgi:hypothetical protein
VSLAAEGGAPFVFATIEGATRPHEAVVLVAHTGSEATAEGGAHGAAAQLGLALVLAKALAADELAAPARSVLLLWGADPAATRTWLASGSHYVVAAVHGHGALAPPPAALHLERALELGPGGESAGAGPRPDGLAVVARCAQADVARLAGGLVTSEGPFSDGGARRPFVAVGVPSVVFRVAADEAAGESLGRLAAAAGATALALADPLPGDLERYLLTNRAQLDARVSAATAASDDSLAPRWRERCTRVRHWFRALCLGGGG